MFPIENGLLRRGVVMEPRPAAIFVGDAVALDFLNSIATPTDTTIDWLTEGEGLLSWLAQAQLIPHQTRESLRAQALPGELDKLAGQARSLREWFRGFVMKHKGRPLTVRDLAQLEPLNRLLARDESFSQIVRPLAKTSAPLVLQSTRRWRSPDALLLPIAEALAQFVCEEDFSNVKACEGVACTLLFADHTRGHARRWCTMAICGNRAKQAAHRHRLKENR
jgi:predicted RNA-binding Zn ribbon-like protein